MRKTLWQEASKDELLMNDIAEIESTFEHVDSEIYSWLYYFSPLEIELTLKSRSGGRDGIMEAIRTRRAIRRFKKDPVPPELIEKCWKRALAPSSINCQPWEFVVVTNQETKQKMSRAFVIGPFLNEAPLVIVVAVDRLKSICRCRTGRLRLMPSGWQPMTWDWEPAG